jgi:hypothetical protein
MTSASIVALHGKGFIASSKSADLIRGKWKSSNKTNQNHIGANVKPAGPTGWSASPAAQQCRPCHPMPL